MSAHLRKRWTARAGTLALVAALAWSACQAAEYGDIAYKRNAPGTDDVPPAVFPHWIHRMQYKCSACHEDSFKMKAGASEVTMDLIQEGKSCGICHNGKTAFESNFDTCPRCHFK
jgi:c(7)-type cytochrome triheme protein